MEPREELIFEETLFKLSEPRAGRLPLLGKSRWKQKVFQIKKIGDKPVLDYYNKKPKSKSATPKGRILLHPSFRIEKIPNTKNRAFVFELTTPDNQICLSAEEQKTVDMFIFVLQIQAQLQDNFKEDLIVVNPENSEAMKRIGAVGTSCILHASPWGMTLALKQSRCIIAQWPIKSIRCYESSGQGLLTLEAGRVAPMGEGIYIFKTVPEEDSIMYDLLDKYIMETLDRSKITRRGTDQEIEDYLQEFDCMHTLTTIKPTTLATSSIARILRENWNYIVPGVTIEDNSPPLPNGRIPLMTQNSNASLGSRHSAGSVSSSSIQSASQKRHFDSVSHSSSANQITESRLTGRPPPPPPRPVKIPNTNGLLGTIVPKPRMTNSNVSTQGYMGMTTTPSPSKSLTSNPISPKSPGFQEWDPPPSFNDAMNFSSPRLTGSGYLSPVQNDNQFDLSYRSKASEGSELSTQNSLISDNSQYLSPVESDNSYIGGGYLTGFHPDMHPVHSYENTREAIHDQAAIDMKKASASCEDLSDHMKSQLYYNEENENNNSAAQPEVDENMNNSAKPPMPFSRLQAFRNSADWDARNRSQSVDYNNVLRPSLLVDRSPSPSVRRIRRLMGKNNHENLRKSVSNPNFLNVGSKEVWTYAKSNGYRPSSCHNSPKLERQSRSKSKSLVELLPAAVRRHLSHENIHRSRNPTPAQSRSTTPERRRDSFKNTNKPVLNRQESAKSFEASIKNIKVTDRSRSFRKVKSFDNEAAAAAPTANSEKLPRRTFDRMHLTHLPPAGQTDRHSNNAHNTHNSHRHNNRGVRSDSFRRNQNLAYVPVHQLVNPVFREGQGQSSA